MSKKFKNKRIHKQQQTISTPLFILMAGGALLLAAGIIIGVQKIGQPDVSGGTPALVVDQDAIQYGDVKFNTNLTFEIKVTNTGDGTLRFKEDPYIEVREGC
jgi:hypothetical protein